MKMKTCIITIFGLATLIAGCAPHIAGTERPPSILPQDKVYYDTQTVVGPCATDAEAAPLLAAVASAVIAQGVNRIGDAIKASADTETKVVTARRNLELRKGKGLGPCITIVRGWFYREPPAYDPAPSPFYVNIKSQWPTNSQPEVAAFWRRGLHMAGTPDFYFQGRIVSSTDGAAYTVLPVMASLDRPISSTPLRPSGTRSVLVSFAFAEAGKSLDLQKGGGTTIVLGKMEPGKLLRFADVNCYAAGKDGKLAPVTSCPGEGTFDTLVRSPFESDWFSVSLGEKSKPMAVQALASETRSASQFLSFVSDVFGATKGTLTERLQQGLIPSVGDAAEETELAAKEKAANDADTAQGKAIADLKACTAAPDDQAKRIAARVSLRSYIQAARKAERQSTIGAGLVDAITTDGIDAGPCQTALSAVIAG